MIADGSGGEQEAGTHCDGAQPSGKEGHPDPRLCGRYI